MIDENSFGKTPLHASCYQGHLDLVKYLVELRPNLETRDFDGDSALHYSCFGNQHQIVEILAKHKADLNAINQNGCSALHVAVNKQYAECVRVLVESGCDVNVQVGVKSVYNCQKSAELIFLCLKGFLWRHGPA